jgi:hypothetical protein
MGWPTSLPTAPALVPLQSSTAQTAPARPAAVFRIPQISGTCKMWHHTTSLIVPVKTEFQAADLRPSINNLRQRLRTVGWPPAKSCSLNDRGPPQMFATRQHSAAAASGPSNMSLPVRFVLTVGPSPVHGTCPLSAVLGPSLRTGAEIAGNDDPEPRSRGFSLLCEPMRLAGCSPSHRR